MGFPKSGGYLFAVLRKSNLKAKTKAIIIHHSDYILPKENSLEFVPQNENVTFNF